MYTYSKRKTEHLLKIEFIRFCIVGGTGFVINFCLLVLLSNYAHLPIFLAQLIAAEIALGSNFYLHNKWTYAQRTVKKSIKTLIIQFHASSWPAIIGSAVMVSVGVKYLHLGKPVALLVSSIITLLWNFFWTKFVIWKGVTKKQIEDIAA